MNEVKTLQYKYYLGEVPVGTKTNFYTGSVSLNPERHCAFDDEFRYRISLIKNEEDEFLVLAECYVGNVAFDIIEKEKISSLTFEGSDEGVEKAREWLQSGYDKLMNR